MSAQRYDLNRVLSGLEHAMSPFAHMPDDYVSRNVAEQRAAHALLTSLRECLILVGEDLANVAQYDGRWEPLARMAESVLEVPEAQG